MIIIKENIEEKSYNHKEWYKEMDKLIGETFDTTTGFENGLSVGQTIIFDAENPILPIGMTIPANSNITLDKLRTVAIEVMKITQKGNNKTISAGIRSSASKDFA